MIKATCMHCNFQSSAETFEELDEIYESHSKTAGHKSDYHFYELDRRVKRVKRRT
jgi:predicted small metal-binding protein